MEVDSAATGAARGSWDRDVCGSIDGFQQLPEDRSGNVAQNRAVAAGEHRCHEVAVEAEAVVTDGVDTAVDAVKVTTLDAAGDAVPAYPKRLELCDRDYSVLPSGDSRDRGIERVEFLPHVGE